MESKKPQPPPRLFASSPLEPRDEVEERHDRCFSLVSSLTHDKTDKEANDALAAAVSGDGKGHEDVCVGLVVGVLGGSGDTESAVRHYRDLTLVARDGLQAACAHVAALVIDKYPRMLMQTRQQLLWLTREMIKSSVANMENICWNLMRQIAGGDVSRPNLWLANGLLDIFVDHRSWLERFPFLLASVVYTYLRIIEDHVHIDKLREKEVRFVVSLMRDRFVDVTVIGRDLLRVLQYVAKIPEFEQLWYDIIHHPKSLAPNFTGITQLMHTRTSRRFLQSRVTPEMEKKLLFLTSQVRFGTHKRYQDWFQRTYLSTSESQSLRCDLIRFIVGVIHPTNELLGSDIIPRWAVIGWLLTTCTNQVASSNAKLALFYDWLFFTPDKDNIMNIEPAILVMHHSMRPHPAITATLLDFLCRIVPNFFPRERERVQQGITNSLRTILDKRVLPSLLPLFVNPRLDEELRNMLRERFSYFCSPREGGAVGEEVAIAGGTLPEKEEEDGDNTPQFSDDEDDDSRGSTRQKCKKSATSYKRQRKERENATASATSGGGEELDEDVKELLKELRSENDSARRCEVMDGLVKAAISEQLEFEQCSALASHLADVLQDEFDGRVFPESSSGLVSAESIEDSIGRPIFVVFRSLCEMADNNPNLKSRDVILQLLAELYTLQPRVGYYLLYFLSADKSASRSAKEKAAVYKDLCEAIDEKYSLDICLVNDMRQCQEDDVALFVYLVPEIFTNFPKHSVGNTDLLYLVVSCVDGSQVQTLVCHVVSRDFILFKKDSFGAVVSSSLGWETFEQYALWQLAAAHDLPIDCVVPLLSKLLHPKHAEALTAALLLLKQEKPTAELLKSLLAREAAPGDRFVTSALSYWMLEYDEKLADLVASHLGKQVSQGSGGKRKRNQPVKGASGVGSSGTGISGAGLAHGAELTLSHLDQLRQSCKQYDFFGQRSIQSALQHVRHACTETQKKRFSDLFALADSDSEQEDQQSSKKKKNSSNSVSASPAGKSNKRNSAKTLQNASDSFEESSDESEENEKPKTSKSSSQRSGSGGAGRGKNPRKRANKVSSYKISSDDSSDDGDVVVSAKKAPPKKKKKVSDSE